MPAPVPSGPWLAPLQPWLGPAWAAWQAGQTVAQALQGLQSRPGLHAPAAWPQLAAGPLAFVPQAALPAGEAYEAFIHRRAQVPTRDNLHDLFNGLVWLSQPALKRRLNALQAAEIARTGVAPRRGALRDALTLFDENGALLLDAPPELWQALRARDWTRLFIGLRPAWQRAQLVVFGHALLEQLALAPRKPLTAHVLLATDPLHLAAEDWAGASNAGAKPFTPLPVLGVPGWWPDNAMPDFYDDPQVFRPPRAQALGAAARRAGG